MERTKLIKLLQARENNLRELKEMFKLMGNHERANEEHIKAMEISTFIMMLSDNEYAESIAKIYGI